jgi:hypothetical protein
VIWIELLSKHHDVLARYRVDADEARIGRAYDNDVVLDDPYVAAHHLLVFRADDGMLIAEDLKSANGLFDANGDRVVHAALDGERPVRVGRTLMRVRDDRFAVPPERITAPPARNGRLAALLALAVTAITSLELWLAQTDEPRTSSWLTPVLLYAGAVLAWTTGWSLISRLFGGAARFTTHLAIALAAALVVHLFDWLTDIGTYSFAVREVNDYAYVGVWVIVGTAILFHLMAIGPRHAPLKAGLVAALVAAAVGVHTLFQIDARHQAGQRAQATTLLPPQWRLRTPQPPDAFFGNVDRMKDELDRARLEEPTTPSLLPDRADE